ncbi:heme ABC exporter ATP-binding protein CcmA [Erythrobacter dokdonensis]|uniref:ABC-type transport system ATPase component n=1 Tax=Erythrobacter dokdonensis DSW-74 TaxID=1300349 RepID=A0A1A7BFW5_9SPHN|nr:heme ABC exporter ATP-binding protein CcmA [Erythrobacter dokdonensis]OBV10115.1 ABC-type transport system ATPase component [Erythrobacter dokdonensis DSW-74]
MQPSLPTLAADNLACRRGDRLLFRRLSFRLEAGAACHVTGANGAGKTTLIRALAGLTTPYAGAVMREGALALLDERTGLDPDLPLGRALAFWFGLDTAPDTGTMIARLRLDALAEVPVRYLSTGQKKRAALARVLGQGAGVWLLDEPLSGLDTDSQGLVMELVREHCADGGIALIASHQPLDLPGMTSFAIEDFAPALEDLAEQDEDA